MAAPEPVRGRLLGLVLRGVAELVLCVLGEAALSEAEGVVSGLVVDGVLSGLEGVLLCGVEGVGVVELVLSEGTGLDGVFSGEDGAVVCGLEGAVLSGAVGVSLAGFEGVFRGQMGTVVSGAEDSWLGDADFWWCEQQYLQAGWLMLLAWAVPAEDSRAMDAAAAATAILLRVRAGFMSDSLPVHVGQWTCAPHAGGSGMVRRGLRCASGFAPGHGSGWFRGWRAHRDGQR